jgi:hypothetical protein
LGSRGRDCHNAAVTLIDRDPVDPPAQAPEISHRGSITPPKLSEARTEREDRAIFPSEGRRAWLCPGF